MKFRVTAYIKECLDQYPSCSSSSSLDRDVSLYKIPKDGWKDIKSIDGKFKLNFNNSHISTLLIDLFTMGFLLMISRR